MKEQLIAALKRSNLLTAFVRAMRIGQQEFTREKQVAAWRRVRERAIQTYVLSCAMRKLQIGTGPYPLTGWLNTDLEPQSQHVIFLDVTKPFPFSDNSFHYAFSEHLIEHLSYKEGMTMLCEIFRVLQVDGKVRIATPNIASLMSLFTEEKNEVQKNYITHTVNKFFPHVEGSYETFVVNNFFQYWGHRFIYDAVTLKRALELAGFIDVIQCEPGFSSDEHLRGIESHGKSIGEQLNHFETMVFEARKPATDSYPSS